jgi:hypothetical protein
MKRLILAGAGLLVAVLTLMPQDASAQWGYRRVGLYGGGFYGGYRAVGGWAGGYYRPWPGVVLAGAVLPPPVVVVSPPVYAYGGPYPFGYGAFYAYRPYAGCWTDDGYGRRPPCDRP